MEQSNTLASLMKHQKVQIHEEYAMILIITQWLNIVGEPTPQASLQKIIRCYLRSHRQQPSKIHETYAICLKWVLRKEITLRLTMTTF